MTLLGPRDTQIASIFCPPSKDHMPPRVSRVTVWQLETAHLSISLYFCAFLLYPLMSKGQSGAAPRHPGGRAVRPGLNPVLEFVYIIYMVCLRYGARPGFEFQLCYALAKDIQARTWSLMDLVSACKTGIVRVL